MQHPSLFPSLAWRDHPQWPPRPLDTILTPAPSWSKKPQDEWMLDEWRAYAGFLLDAGRDMKRELVTTRTRLAEARKKAMRRPKRAARTDPSTTILHDILHRKPRGRPREDGTRQRAQEAYNIRRELALKLGKKATNLVALEEWHRRAGNRPQRAHKDKAIGFMRKLHTARNGGA